MSTSSNFLFQQTYRPSSLFSFIQGCSTRSSAAASPLPSYSSSSYSSAAGVKGLSLLN
jgi:hypothetical protein